MYQKEIIYMGLHKNGSRLGSAGFLKVENRDRESSLYLKVKNIPHSINGRFPVRFYNGTDWREVDGISIQEGSGLWEARELGLLKQLRLQIMLPGGYVIEGISKEAEQKIHEPMEEIEQKEEKKIKEQENVRREEIASVEGNTSVEENASVKENVKAEGNAKAEETYVSQIAESGGAERIPVQKQRRSMQETVTEAPVMVSEELPHPMADKMQINGVKEDKWEQILDTYDQIHPYGDERVYVKLEPKDFVILQAKYQQLVNNSFLLHGFYNYRYVILGKENDYYLGVPGVFYEREKMVALMFGFEAFECQSGEAKPGEFGYYLRRVEL